MLKNKEKIWATNYVYNEDGTLKSEDLENSKIWWKIEKELCERLIHVGYDDIELKKDYLVDIIEDQAHQIQEAEDRMDNYKLLVKHSDDQSAKLLEQNKELIDLRKSVNFMKDIGIKYGTHVDTCPIFDSVESGRILDNVKCNCGWKEQLDNFE